MSAVLEWGYDVILWAQQASPALDGLFKSITMLGAKEAFLLILPLVFWCVNKRVGIRLGLLLMLSAYLNLVLKELFNQPRPSADRVEILADETNPGLPSGHTQNSIVIYGYLAAQVRRPWAWAAAGLIVVCVGWSRIYLGVHFPSDVLGGLLFGVIVLALYLWLEPEVESRLRLWPWRHKLALTIAGPITLFLLSANQSSAQLLGILLGLSVGILIESRWIRFSTTGALWQRALRFALGIVVLAVVWLGLKAIFPDEPGTVALILRLIRYTLVGIWASLGAPWLFVRLGLASQESAAWHSL